jgi:hypothetical protein
MVATSSHWYFDFGPFTIDQKRGRLHLELAPAADRCYTTLGRHVVTERVEIPPTSSGRTREFDAKSCSSFVTGHLSHVTLRHIAQPRHAANTLRHIGYCGIHTKTYIFEKISIHLLLSLQLQWPAIGIVLMMLRGLQFGSEVQAPRKSKIVPENMTTKTYCRKALTNRRTCDPDHVTWKQHALM